MGLRPQDPELVEKDTLTVDIDENLGGERLIVETKGVLAPAPGAKVDVLLDPTRLSLFHPDSGGRLR